MEVRPRMGMKVNDGGDAKIMVHDTPGEINPQATR